MNIGIIGAGEIGGTLTRRLTQLGHTIFVANSRGPDSLAELVAETGATAVTVFEAARSGEIVFVAIPVWKVAELPKGLFDGVGPSVVVVDTVNYYPQERDGRIDEIEAGMTESRWLANQLGRTVVKAVNTIYWRDLLNEGKPAGAAGRLALPVAGDNVADMAKVVRLFDALGFDAVDAGDLDESWRQQPGTPVYATCLDADGVRHALAAATPERKAEMRSAPIGPPSQPDH